MIHIIITVQAGRSLNQHPRAVRPVIVLQHFETKATGKDEATIGRVLRTLLQPFLQELARKENARFHIVE